MSRKRQLMFAAICLASCLWALTVLFAASIRFEHKGMVDMIRNGQQYKQPEKIEEALLSISGAMRIIPCTTELSDDYLLLRAYDADLALSSENEERADLALASMEEAAGQRLGCTPRDGKVWLDLATIVTLHEGFSKRALADYKMSARVAPGESWLAQKRLEFALKFRPMLDQEALTISQADIAVLERAHPNKMTAIKTAAGVASVEALRSMFAQQ